MNEAKLIQDADRILKARLPRGWKCRIRALSNVRDRGADAVLDIVGPDGARGRFAVEIKNRLFPRAVADIKAQLTNYSENPGLVIAAFLTPSTRERLEAFDLNYLDLTGNVRLALPRPALYLETLGAAGDPTPAKEPGRSLRGPKAGRIVRALCDFAPPLTISDLAGKSKVDVSYASRLVEWLARESLLERRPRGAVEAVERPALIRRWASDYAVLTSNAATGYIEPRGLDNLIRSLRNLSVRGKYAVTGSLVANKLAPIAMSKLAMIYADNVDAVVKALKLQPTDAGTNVMLLSPFDDVVFERTWTADGLTLVAPSQAAVDLMTSPGRGPAEAEAVLEILAKPSRSSRGSR
jgi:hypothetical protein